MSTAPKSGMHPAIAVNGGMLGAVLCGSAAYALWPTAPEWWGLGVASVILAMAAAGCLFNAIGAMVGRYRRERELRRYLMLGSGPKSARLATMEDLRRAGMVE